MTDIPAEFYDSLLILLKNSESGLFTQGRDLPVMMSEYVSRIEKGREEYRILINPSKELMQRVRDLEKNKAQWDQRFNNQEQQHKQELQQQKDQLDKENQTQAQQLQRMQEELQAKEVREQQMRAQQQQLQEELQAHKQTQEVREQQMKEELQAHKQTQGAREQQMKEELQAQQQQMQSQGQKMQAQEQQIKKHILFKKSYILIIVITWISHVITRAIFPTKEIWIFSITYS